jgi:hypothetical protein
LSDSTLVAAFQFLHFSSNLFQPFLSQLMFHIVFVAVPRAAPVQLICSMDCLNLRAQHYESGTKSVIHNRILRKVTIRANMGEGSGPGAVLKPPTHGFHEMMIPWPKRKEI